MHSCRCGAVEVQVNVPGPQAGTRIICYCKDCQTSARLHEGGADVLAPDGGTDIWQTTPDRIEILRGVDHLTVFRLSPKGLMRWHARCCGTPMFNTLPNVKISFVGVVLRQSALAEADSVYGKIRCHAHTHGARPGAGAPQADRGFKRAGFDVLQRMLASFLSRRSRQNPLVQADDTPIAPVEVITKETRRAALPDHLK